MKRAIVFVFSICLIVGVTFGAVTAQTVASSDGMVAAANAYAAEIGAEILEKGGNALDAAIAVSFALGVVEPYASGLGGEGYAVITMANGEKHAVDFKSMAPGGVTYDLLEELETSISDIRYTPKGALVPGVPAGIQKVYDLGATLPLEELIAPAIELAREGFVVNETFAKVTSDKYEALLNSAPEFLNDMLAWETGDVYKNEALAETMEMIAENGIKCFYEGQIAEDIAQYMEENDGFITKEDLENYVAYVKKPVQGTYRGYDVIVPGPPVSGPQLIAILNMLENYNLGLMGWDDPLAIHIIQQTLVLEDVDRRYFISDPDYYDLPVEGFMSKEYARRRIMKIDLNQAIDPDTYWDHGGNPTPFEEGKSFEDVLIEEGAKEAAAELVNVKESPSTTHFSILDKEGNAVAWTQTNSSFFGTTSFVNGFFMNNEIGNFASTYRDWDVINLEPGMRPRTTICPTIIEKDGEVRFIIGTPGGGRIVSTITNLIVDLIDFEMPVDKAIAKPKFVGYVWYDKIRMEKGLPEKTLEALEALGHELRLYEYPDLYFGGPNLISVGQDGMMIGAGSIRRNGAASAPEM